MSAFLYLGRFWGVSRIPTKYMGKAALQSFLYGDLKLELEVIQFSWCNGGDKFGRFFWMKGQLSIATLSRSVLWWPHPLFLSGESRTPHHCNSKNSHYLLKVFKCPVHELAFPRNKIRKNIQRYSENLHYSFLYLCSVYPGVCVCKWVPVCLSVCKVCRKSVDIFEGAEVPIYCIFLLFAVFLFETLFLPALGACWFSKNSCQKATGILLLLPQHWDYRHRVPQGTFYWGHGIWTQVLKLVWNILANHS